MSISGNPSFRGPGKQAPFKTRAPVGKLGNIFKKVPHLGVPLFGNRPTAIQQVKANTPAFRGPAKLPSNFMKSGSSLLGLTQQVNPRAAAFNGPIRIPGLGHGGLAKQLKKLTPRAGLAQQLKKLTPRAGKKGQKKRK